MAFKKGESGNPNGRPAGVPNKLTSSVKAAILDALNADEGAVEFFRKLKNGSREDKRTFAHICARLLPTEISGPDGKPLLMTEAPDMLEMARSISFVLTRADAALTEPEKPDSTLPRLDTVGNLAPANADTHRGLNGNAGSQPLHNGHGNIFANANPTRSDHDET